MARPQVDRESYLAEVCADDDGLRREVVSLLQHASVDTPLFGSPPDGQGPVAALREAIRSAVEPPCREGQVIGAYTIRQVLGTGGTSVVYQASQEAPFRREVAIKVLKPGMDSRAVLTRFDRERQALAMMDHPNVAKVYDAGAAKNGRPYFVMELIRGEPVTAFCDARGLDDAARIDLFLTICNAVQHAHMRGVLHRDLKPSNILVEDHGGEPFPKIIDFGISKAIHETDALHHTLAGHILGTPAYMSPEQWEPERGVDVRADVYALGVALYELLTGRLPYDFDSAQESSVHAVRAVIDRDDPMPPSRCASGERARRLRGDLDWILLKAVAKDPRGRYRSVEALAEDLRRYRARLPIEARPPSVLYQAGLYCRRRRTTALIAASSLVATIISVSALAYHASRIDRELAEKTEALRRAEAAEAEASERAAELSTLTAFQGAQMLRLRPSLIGLRLREDLEDAIDPALRPRLRACLECVDLTAISRGVLWKELYEPSLRAIETTFADDPHARAALLFRMGQTLAVRGLPERAIGPMEEALALTSASPDRAAVSFPAGLVSLSDVYRLAGRLGDAERVLTEVLNSVDASRDPLRHETQEAGVRLAATLVDLGRLDEAERLLPGLVEANRQRKDERDQLRLLGEISYGRLLLARGEAERAEAYFRHTLDVCDRMFTSPHGLTTASLVHLGAALRALGRPLDAEPIARRALDMTRLIHGREHAKTAFASCVLGGVLTDLGRHDEAEAHLLEAQAALEALGGDPGPSG